MALHLLTRNGGQKIIVSCAIPDKDRQCRIYKIRHRESGNTEFRLCSKFLVRFRSEYLRWRYRDNASLGPIPEMPTFLKEHDDTE